LVDRPVSDHAPWVIDGLLREGWRVVLVASEGSGKMTWLRQIALCAANGVHPLTWKACEPVETLVVDLENPLDVVYEGAQRIVGQVRKEQGDDYRKHGAWLFHQPGGVDLRSRADRARLEVALCEVRPKVVVVGPLYKAFRRGKGESDEEAASAVAAVFDDLRSRFGFALLIEHHAPKGAMSGRDLVPFGSSLWMRWPEFGLTLEPTGNPREFTVGRFRKDRVAGAWPRSISWAQRFPFSSTFDGAMP
jgi:replicative DNA helicase